LSGTLQDLKVKTDALQKTIPKNDKDIKKKVTTEIQQMQRALNEKHKKETEAWEVRLLSLELL
jgi:hypothetical protein